MGIEAEDMPALHGVIDARALDPESQAVAWLRSQVDVEGLGPMTRGG